MKFNPKKPVRARNGRPARIICDDADGGTGWSIVALLGDEGAHNVYCYQPDGRINPAEISPNDLVNVPGIACRICGTTVLTGPEKRTTKFPRTSGRCEYG